MGRQQIATGALSNVDYEVSGVQYAISGVDYVTVNLLDQLADVQPQSSALKSSARVPAEELATNAATMLYASANAALDAASKAETKATDTANALYTQASNNQSAHCPDGATQAD